MATWVLPSQLLLIALCSWDVYCFPAKKGFSQRDRPGSSLSNMEGRPSVRYRSPHGAPAQPSSVSNPAAADEGRSSPGADPARSSLTPDVSGEASWNARATWDPLEESTAASGISRPALYVGPPPFRQASEHDHYDANVEAGSPDGGTEELNLPAPLAPPFPYPDFQAEELIRHTPALEHGNREWETEEQGFMPPPPYASAVEGSTASTSFPEQPVPLELAPVGWSQYYLFLTGQLPTGTYNHFLSDYETGRGLFDEAHYGRYHLPTQTWRTQDFIQRLSSPVSR